MSLTGSKNTHLTIIIIIFLKIINLLTPGIYTTEGTKNNNSETFHFVSTCNSVLIHEPLVTDDIKPDLWYLFLVFVLALGTITPEHKK